MGRRSKELRERREKRVRDADKSPGQEPTSGRKRSARAAELEDQLSRLADGDAVFCNRGNLPDSLWESHLEDVLAFESVGSGTSLFEGLQEHGVDLPPPEKLDERQSADKVKEVLYALVGLKVFLIGFEDMTAREFYSTLWSQTLWEGCYVEKRNPWTVTIMDVSHRMSRQDMQRYLEDLIRPCSVH